MAKLNVVLLLGLMIAGCAGPGTGLPSTSPSRSFSIRYVATVTDLPVGEPMRMWIPLPHDDPHQRVRSVQVHGLPEGWTYRVTEDPIYKNQMIYLDQVVNQKQIEIEVSYDVDRWAYEAPLADLEPDGEVTLTDLEKYLSPSRYCIVDENIVEEARSLSANKNSTLRVARAFYDHVAGNMVYDKNHKGWGLGSTVHACEVGKGNCTDFHSYFVSLCMAQNIASRFQIGLYGRYEREEAEYKTGGYHCWAEFRVPGKSWVPVDISEGDKDPSRADYFFGNHTDNRVTLSTGRDVVLSPAQASPPLNYFLLPHVEVSGKKHRAVKKTSYWRDR